MSPVSPWELHTPLCSRAVPPLSGVSILAAELFFLSLPSCLVEDSFSPWLFAFQVDPQSCTFPCQCPSKSLQCPAGTSHVWDACGCCKVCAQQLGELCSLHRPCDHHKGLYCNFSKIHRGSGICLGENCRFCPCVFFAWCLPEHPSEFPWSFILCHAGRSVPALGTAGPLAHTELALHGSSQVPVGLWDSPVSCDIPQGTSFILCVNIGNLSSY